MKLSVLLLILLAGTAAAETFTFPGLDPKKTFYIQLSDADGSRPVVVVKRDGARIISIDIYPPKGVPVKIHKAGLTDTGQEKKP